jgi:alpha-galactosidase/6-phospho-beta-glucosidase family protein
VLEAKNPKSILQLREHLRDMLFDAILLMDANVFEMFSTYLQQVADTIEQDISKESFESTESEVIFLNHMKWWIAAMISFLEAWEAIQELYDEMEISCSKKCFYMTSTKTFCFKTLPWPHFASNRANPRTHDILAEAEKKGFDVNFRLQRLPRGCITIVELWRKDVNAVVESILQVSVFRSSCGSSHEALSANQYADQ